jgi:hypothetical protein
MVKNILIIFISDIRNHLKDRKFMVVNLFAASIPALLIILSLPYNRFEIGEFPINGQLYTLSVLLILSYINLNSLQGGIVFFDVLSSNDWKERLGCKYFSLYFAKFLSMLLQNLILLISNLPIGVMVLTLGGFTFSSLKIYFICTYLIINSLGIIGMFFNYIFDSVLRITVLYIYLIFGSLIMFPLNRMESDIYIDLKFLPYLILVSFILFLLLIFPPFHEMVNNRSESEMKI